MINFDKNIGNLKGDQKLIDTYKELYILFCIHNILFFCICILSRILPNFV